LPQARDLLLAAAEIAEDQNVEAGLLAEGMRVTLYLGDVAGATELVRRLEALHPLAPESRASAMLAAGMGRVLAGMGGVEQIRSAIPLLETGDGVHFEPRRLAWLMLAVLFLRDVSEARRVRDLVDALRPDMGAGRLAEVLWLVARYQATTEAWTTAGANYSEAVRLARETGQESELAMALAGLAWLESRQGKEEDCRAHAAEALALCGARDIHFGQAWADYALGDLDLSLGEAGAAVARLQSLVDWLDGNGLDDPDLAPAPELVDALLRSGERDRAARLAWAHLERARAKDRPWALARAHRAVGLVAEDFDSFFATALSWHLQTPDRFEEARTRLAFGARLRRAGRRMDARPELRWAVTEFERLGARQWGDQAASELAATGETVRRTESGVVPELTAQELQVCLMLAGSRTTRETAAALYLSPKTVEYHLRKVYVKLGIRSRAELAQHLQTSSGFGVAGGSEARQQR
ncbi:MAG: LuxR C-terminal-related transcriptional regulator, partial [Candidatus Phosphoribacter sp.]